MLQIGTDVYIGGLFTQVAGGVRAASIAHWNGRTWAALGSGLRRRCNSDDSQCGVAALASAPNGDIYAGGNFIEAGGQPVLGLARWDGRAWHPVGTGLGGSIGALAVAPNGDLYVAGRLYMGDSLAEKWGATGSFCAAEETVAKWDGHTWQLLGGGPVGQVWALAVGKRGEVYAGGAIMLFPGGLSYEMECQPAYDVARWDGRRWHSLGAGIDSSRSFAQPTVCALAVTPAGDLYAGGDFRTAGGQPANGLARWDGHDWHPVGQGPGVDGYVRSLALAPTGELYATGLFRQAGGTPATAVACWNGTAWQALGGGLNGEGCAMALGGTGGVVVGGMFSQAGGLPAPGVACWGGRDWHPLGAGTSTGGFATALATGPQGTLYLSGFLAAPTRPRGREEVVDGQPYFVPDFDSPPVDAVVTHRLGRWDGTAWHPLGPGRASEVSGCVTALAATGRRKLYAGGTFAAIGGQPARNVACWNGHAWRALGAGLGNSASAVTAVAVAANGDLYAAGFFAAAGGRPARGLARWNGRTWSPVGTDLATASVTALALTAQGTVYAAGNFSPTDPVGAAQLARWSGTAWVVVATTPRPVTITALAVAANGDLYTGATTGAFEGSFLMRWDGSAWRSLPGSHAEDEHILALALDDSAALFLGGDFNEIRRFGRGVVPPADAPVAPAGRAFQRLGQGLTDARLYPAPRPPRRRRRSPQPPPPVAPPASGQGW